MNDDELLAQPGCMRALWQSKCRGCGQQIKVGDIVHLGGRDARVWWLCRNCPEEEQ